MIERIIIRPLVSIGDMVGGLLAALPMTVVRMMFMGVFAILTAWVMFLPPQLDDGGENRRGDLRYFAIGVLALQMLCYLFLS